MADGTSDDEQTAYHIRAVERVCALLDLLQSSPGGVSLAGAANATGLAKSSTFRYLVTLVDRDYAHHAAESGLYRAGRALFAHHASQVETLTLNARPLLAALAGELQETVMLGYLDATRLLYLDIRDSPRLVRSGPRQGDRDVIHATALGKRSRPTSKTSRCGRCSTRRGCRRSRRARSRVGRRSSRSSRPCVGAATRSRTASTPLTRAVWRSCCPACPCGSRWG